MKQDKKQTVQHMDLKPIKTSALRSSLYISGQVLCGSLALLFIDPYG